jgi:uncharacterized protein with WD repeat
MGEVRELERCSKASRQACARLAVPRQNDGSIVRGFCELKASACIRPCVSGWKLVQYSFSRQPSLRMIGHGLGVAELGPWMHEGVVEPLRHAMRMV